MLRYVPPAKRTWNLPAQGLEMPYGEDYSDVDVDVDGHGHGHVDVHVNVYVNVGFYPTLEWWPPLQGLEMPCGERMYSYLSTEVD